MSPRPPDCPTEEALSRLFADGQQAEIATHLDQCPDCAAQWSAMARLRAEARAIATPRLSPVRRDAVRAAVLAETARRAPRRVRRDRRWPAVALAAVAAVLLIGAGLALWPRAAPVAEVHAHAAAPFSRLGDADDDIVRLVEGVVTVEVRPRAPGQRFRVVTGDAEVEVRGTAFDVEARGDRLVGVRVLHGRVAVRCEGQP
ncbi:MAG: FecR domain-containing protein, partial [Myxococcales bacterium]|nr:FecR domain-containing protein [Myxococcales bacterium]